jgi:hypothetical protein
MRLYRSREHSETAAAAAAVPAARLDSTAAEAKVRAAAATCRACSETGLEIELWCSRVHGESAAAPAAVAKRQGGLRSMWAEESCTTQVDWQHEGSRAPSESKARAHEQGKLVRPPVQGDV